MTDPARPDRRLPAVEVESVGRPEALDGIAALLVARMRPPPTLTLVPPADVEPRRSVSPVEQGPV